MVMAAADPPSNLIISLTIFLLLITTVHSSSSSVIGDQLVDLDLEWGMMSSSAETTTFSSGCQGAGGTIGECLADEEEEFQVDSEINRRILATRRYISYGALRRNNVPCSRRGASYYNCRPGASANPYRRGCSRITRCRR